MADQLEAGLVVSVAEVLAGDELLAATPAGATTLVLGDAVDFPEGGGELQIAGDTVLAFTSADLDTDTLHLAAPTTVAYEEGEQVLVLPLAVERLASVALDGDDESVEARVPHALFDHIAEGVRDPGTEERVSLVLDGNEWVVSDLLGREPLVDGSYIDPTTMPPVDVGPTAAPTTSPVPTVNAGSGVAVVRWLGVEDATRYDLYVATDPAAPIDATTLHTENVHSPVWVTYLNSEGSQPIPTDVDTYFALVARNDLGAAPGSAWVAGRAGTISDAILSSSLALVQNVVSELVETAGLTIGTGSWTAESGIDIPGVLNFPVDGSKAAQLVAAVVAQSLTIENYLSVRGTVNAIETGAKVALAQGVTPPTAAPTVTNYWQSFQTLAVPSGWTVTAFKQVTYDTFMVGAGTTFGYYLKFDATGAEVARLYSGSGGKHYGTIHAITGDNADGWLALVKSGANGDWYLQRINSTLTTITAEYHMGTDGWHTHRPVMAGYNATYFRIVGYSGSNLFERLMPYANPGDQFTVYHFDGEPAAFDIVGFTDQVPGDTANNRIGLYKANGNAAAFQHGSTTPFPRASTYDFPRPYGKTLVGGDGITMLDSQNVVYRNKGRTLLTGEASYTWRDTDAGGTGTHETTVSPVASLSTVARGAGATVTTPPPPDTGDPDAPDRATVYARATSAATWARQGDAALADNTLDVLSIASGVAPPTSSTFATSGLAPAILSSAAGDATPYIELKGDGSGRAGPYQWNSTGKATLRNQTMTPTMADVKVHNCRVWESSPNTVCVVLTLDVDVAKTRQNTGMVLPTWARPEAEMIVGIVGDYRYFIQTTGVIEFECAGNAPYESAQGFWFVST